MDPFCISLCTKEGALLYSHFFFKSEVRHNLAGHLDYSEGWISIIFSTQIDCAFLNVDLLFSIRATNTLKATSIVL
jgi:hypothetical protein